MKKESINVATTVSDKWVNAAEVRPDTNIIVMEHHR